MKNLFFVSLTFIFTILIIRPVSSQTLEMSMVPDSISTLELDFTKLLISNDDQSLISGNYNLQYKHVLNKKFNLIGEFSYINFRRSGGSSNTGLSNIYLGFQYKTSKKDNINSALNVGIYLPTASQEAQFGFFNNLLDLPKFWYEATDIHVGYNSFFHFNNGLRIGFEVGSDFIIPLGDNNNDTELLGEYAFSLMYKSKNGIYIQTELLGIANLTADGGFDESTFHTYALGFGYNGNKIGAGVYFRNYFDEQFGDNFNGILGVKLSAFF